MPNFDVGNDDASVLLMILRGSKYLLQNYFIYELKNNNIYAGDASGVGAER